MVVARRELERRLGNGWCSRRAYLECRHELVCQRCVHFSTDRLVLPVLAAQHANAVRRGQQARVDPFAMLVAALDAADQTGAPRAEPAPVRPVVSGPGVADFSGPRGGPAVEGRP
jgi:hypothetical protein